MRDNVKRDAPRFWFSVSEKERETIKHAAEVSGMKDASFIRYAALKLARETLALEEEGN